MASTRNRNTVGDYNCERQQVRRTNDYRFDTVFGEQNDSNIRLFSLGAGPSKMYSGNMAHNNVDIESKLRGIMSTNLEGESFNPSLQGKSFRSVELFDNHLRDNVYLPNPFMNYVNERAGYHNM